MHLRDRMYHYFLNTSCYARGSTTARRVLGDLEWNLEQAFSHCQSQSKYFNHMKTELLVCAEKKS